jgi:hypothetical protein
MADQFSYVFDNLTRIGNDEVIKTQADMQNMEHYNYMVNNHYQYAFNNAREFATSQPGILYSEGYNIPASQVDNSSKLIFGGVQVNPRGNITLFSRPFLTVPYLGRGTVDPLTESYMLRGEMMDANRKSLNLMAETNMVNLRQIPDLDKEKMNTYVNSNSFEIGNQYGISSRRNKDATSN